MAKLPQKLERKLEKRRLDDALRELPKSRNLIDFSSNDYLGLSRKDEIAKEGHQLLESSEITKNSSTGSRLLTGNHALYQELEEFLARHHRANATLVFNSGYDANIGFFSCVPQRGDIIFYDELVHASIRDGIQMSNAKSYKFAHNNIEDLSCHIERSRNIDSNTEIYVVTESVFSMDGDTPDLKALANYCNAKGYHLIVDEAHATGIFGNGKDMVCELQLEKKVFARVITFGKALGNHGAAVLGSEKLKSYLINFARSLIYSTALPPHTIACILAAYKYLEKRGADDHTDLQNNIIYFKEQLVELEIQKNFIESHSAIHCLVVPGNKRVKQLSKKLETEGFDVRPILSPTVKVGQERLRFCLHSYNTKEEISRILSLVKNLLDK